MLSFGLGYSASLRVWQLRSLVNPLIVGRLAGVEGVAYVGLAIRIAEGLGFVRAAAGRLTIAALSRLRVDRASLRAAYERALTLQVLCLGPLLCAFALAAPVVVPRVLGIRWMPSLRIYPFVAAAVLVNSVYNLQAAALFVEGRQWIVLKAYATHVGLLAVVTFLMLPRFGLAGYGWAELAGCGAYAILHAGMARILPISYRKLWVLVLVFLLPLFGMVSHGKWTILLWTPLVVVASRYLGTVVGAREKKSQLAMKEPAAGGLVISEPRPTGAV